MGLKSNNKENGYPHNSHSTIVSVGIACQSDHSCSSWGPQLGKTTDDFSPKVACMALANTVNAGQQGGNF